MLISTCTNNNRKCENYKLKIDSNYHVEVADFPQDVPSIFYFELVGSATQGDKKHYQV